MYQNLYFVAQAAVFTCCAAAAITALREAWKPVPQPRWSGTLITMASLLVVLDWALLLRRDWELTNTAGVVVASLDSFIVVLGLAWIPCFFLLRIRQPGMRSASYIVASLLALVWIATHIPTHAIPPQVRTDTAAMHVAVALIGFAFLNLVLVVLPSQRSKSAADKAPQVRLASGTAAAACVSAIVVGLRGL